MAFSKFIFPALSVAAVASAQRCGSGDTTTVRNPSDIAACTTYSGSITVATGSASAGTLDFGNIEKIDGDFSYENDAGVQTIRLGSLEEVTGDFTYNNLSALSATGLGSLQTVGGKLTLQGLGSLSQLGLDAGIESVDSVTIINTNIQSFEGIQNASRINNLEVSNNLNLGEIALSVSEMQMISIGPNRQANGGQSVSFANLENADVITIRNSSEVDLGSLTNATQGCRLIGNSFESFEASQLTHVGTLIVNSNPNLSELSFPALEMVDGGNSTLQVANNSKLLEIRSFPKLTEVGDDVSIRGNFSELELPELNRVGGALIVRTASSNFDCGPWEGSGDDANQVARGTRGEKDCRPGDASQLSGGSGTDNADSSESSDFASPLDIPTDFMTGFVVLSSLLSVFM